MADQPDFWQSSVVNLILQDLPEIINRPKYGLRGVLEYTNYVNPSVVTSLGIISGKGMLYGGAIIVAGAATCGGDSVGSAADAGGQHFTPTLLQSILFNLTAQHGFTWQLECYDDTNFYYAVSAAAQITFESSFELLYKEAAGRTPLVIAKLMYAVV